MKAALIGCDPELSVDYASMTAIDWYQFDARIARCGTKDQPSVWQDVQIHADSMFVEIAPRPQASVGHFLSAFYHGVEVAEQVVERTLFGCDYVDTATLPEFNETNAPFLWRCSQTVGCSPDIHDGVDRFEAPPWVAHKPVKEAGGHLHIDLPDHIRGNADSIRDVARDFYAATQAFHVWDHESQPWYRIPLLYRITPYGMEYRSIGAGVFNRSAELETLITTAFDFQRRLFNRG